MVQNSQKYVDDICVLLQILLYYIVEKTINYSFSKVILNVVIEKPRGNHTAYLVLFENMSDSANKINNLFRIREI